ncbi:MAG: hypothetical protein PHE88_02940 [Elusimicrobia bacterium]|nr:hypothetical protein [Elusimicrobiota bacterium]
MTKQFVAVLLSVMISSTLFAADIIHLKNGDILKGKIIGEGGDTFKIEMENQSKEIQRKDIEKIEWESKKENTVKETKKNKSKTVNTVKIALDFAGTNHVTTVSGSTGKTHVRPGVTLAGETLLSVHNNIRLGMGLAIEFPRVQTGAGKDNFMFLPWYGIVQVSDFKKNGIAPYLTMHLGLAAFFGSDVYKDSNEQRFPGFYFATGIGAVSKKKNLQAELLYAMHSYTTYNTLRLSAGYNF